MCGLSMAVLAVSSIPTLAIDEGDVISLAQRDFIANRDAATSPDLLRDAGEPLIALQTAGSASRPCRTVSVICPTGKVPPTSGMTC